MTTITPAGEPLVWFPAPAGAPTTLPPTGHIYFGYPVDDGTAASRRRAPISWSPTATGGHATPPAGYLYVGYPDTAPTPTPAPPTPAPPSRTRRNVLVAALALAVVATGPFAAFPIIVWLFYRRAQKNRRAGG